MHMTFKKLAAAALALSFSAAPAMADTVTYQGRTLDLGLNGALVFRRSHCFESVSDVLFGHFRPPAIHKEVPRGVG